jgi:hypothetical protein
LVGNGKHRRKNIFQLEKDECTIVGEENRKVHITEYVYLKRRFQITLVWLSLKFLIPQLSDGENHIRVADFTDKEVLEAIMQMEKNKTLGLDGFRAEGRVT